MCDLARLLHDLVHFSLKSIVFGWILGCVFLDFVGYSLIFSENDAFNVNPSLLRIFMTPHNFSSVICCFGDPNIITICSSYNGDPIF